MAIRVSGPFDQSTSSVVWVSLGFEIRTQNRPHDHAPQVLRDSKGSGTSMAIRVSGPSDQSTPGVGHEHESYIRSNLNSDLKT